MGGKKKWNARITIARHPKSDDVHPLEAFSSDSLKSWERRGKLVRQYYYAQFYELESQRAAHQKEITEALRQAPTKRIELEGWCRLINFRWSQNPLSPAGSLRDIGGRFNYGEDIGTRFAAFPALYLAQDFRTTYFEYFGLELGENKNGLTPEELALEDKGNFVSLSLRGHVSNAFDLTNPGNVTEFCKVIGKFRFSQHLRQLERQVSGKSTTTVVNDSHTLLRTMYDENWRAPAASFGIPSNSQIFGKLLVDAGIEAVLYESTRTKALCLAVFTRQLVGSDTRIEIHEDHPAEAKMCVLDANNCLEV